MKIIPVIPHDIYRGEFPGEFLRRQEEDANGGTHFDNNNGLQLEILQLTP